MDYQKITEEEFLAQYEAACEADRIADLTEPRAKSVSYNPETGRIDVELKLGQAFSFPPSMFPHLAGLTPEQLATVETDPMGEGIIWEEANLDVATAGVLARIMGDYKLQAFASRGGLSRSEAKGAAARINGRKGGRPRKKKVRPAEYPTTTGYGVMKLREPEHPWGVAEDEPGAQPRGGESASPDSPETGEG